MRAFALDLSSWQPAFVDSTFFSRKFDSDSNSPLYLTLPLAAAAGRQRDTPASSSTSAEKRVPSVAGALDYGECMERPKGKKEKGLPGDSLYIYCNYPRICPVHDSRLVCQLQGPSSSRGYRFALLAIRTHTHTHTRTHVHTHTHIHARHAYTYSHTRARLG